MPKEGVPQSETDQEAVKADLRRFLQEVFESDQSDPERKDAPECYAKLKSRERDFIGSPVEDEYWDAVSFEIFHIGQSKALAGDPQGAKSILLEAREAAEKGMSDEWLAYIEGTLEYLDNDKEALKQTMHRVKDNKPVLQRLLTGLEKRGSPNYRMDYSGE